MNEQMIAVAEFENELEAEIARGHLHAAGIRAILSKDDAGGMLPSLQDTGGVSVLVMPGEMRMAKAILHDTSRHNHPSGGPHHVTH